MNGLLRATYRILPRLSSTCVRTFAKEVPKVKPNHLIRNICLSGGAFILGCGVCIGVSRNSSLKIFQYLFQDRNSHLRDKDFRTAVALATLDIAMQPHSARLVSKSYWGTIFTTWILHTPRPSPEIVSVLSYLSSINSNVLRQALRIGGYDIFYILLHNNKQEFEKGLLLLTQSEPCVLFDNKELLLKLYNESDSTIIKTFVLWCLESFPSYSLHAYDLPLVDDTIPYYQKLHYTRVLQHILPPESHAVSIKVKQLGQSITHNSQYKHFYNQYLIKLKNSLFHFVWIQNIYKFFHKDKSYSSLPMSLLVTNNLQIDMNSINSDPYSINTSYYLNSLNALCGLPEENIIAIYDGEESTVQSNKFNSINEKETNNNNINNNIITNSNTTTTINNNNNNDIKENNILYENPCNYNYEYKQESVYIKPYIDILAKWILNEDDLLATSSIKALNNILIHPASLAYFIDTNKYTILDMCENNNVHLYIPYRRELSKLLYIISTCTKDMNNQYQYIFDEDKTQDEIVFNGVNDMSEGVEYQTGSDESIRWKKCILYLLFQNDLCQCIIGTYIMKNYLHYSETPYRLFNEYFESIYRLLTALVSPSLGQRGECYYNKSKKNSTEIWNIHCLLRALSLYMKNNDCRSFLITHNFLFILECLQKDTNPEIQGEIARALGAISLGYDERSNLIRHYIIHNWIDTINIWKQNTDKLKVKYMCDKLLYNTYHNINMNNSIALLDNNDYDMSIDDYTIQSNNPLYNQCQVYEELDDGVFIMNYDQLIDKHNNIIEPDVDIVFIHGVGGSFYKTWVTEDDKTYCNDVWISNWLTNTIQNNIHIKAQEIMKQIDTEIKRKEANTVKNQQKLDNYLYTIDENEETSNENNQIENIVDSTIVDTTLQDNNNNNNNNVNNNNVNNDIVNNNIANNNDDNNYIVNSDDNITSNNNNNNNTTQTKDNNTILPLHNIQVNINQLNEHIQTKIQSIQEHPYAYKLFRKLNLQYNTKIKESQNNIDTYNSSSHNNIHIRILSIKYPAKVSKSKSHMNMNLSELSSIVEKQLNEAGIGNRPVIFVVHSMGGIILKSIFVKQYKKSYYSSLLYSTLGICFYSTPHYGTPVIKNSYKYFDSIGPINAAVVQLAQSSPELYQLNKDFLSMSYVPQLLCICEGKPVQLKRFSWMIVPVSSSRINNTCDYYVHNNANHIEICKPKDQNDPRYTKLTDFITNLILNMEPHEEDIIKLVTNNLINIKDTNLHNLNSCFHSDK